MKKINSLFKSSAGIFDLTSVMVGIIVTAIIAGAVGITFIVVVPWLNDNAARSTVATVRTAETSARQDLGQYVDYPTLVSQNYVSSTTPNVCVAVAADKKSFSVYVKSASSKVYTASSTAEASTEFTGTVPCSY